MIDVQHNQCAICKKVFLKTPCIDHNHETGKIRALLCRKCNFQLGYIENNLVDVKSMIDYLQKYNIGDN